jgi:hypothetical protein
MREGFLDTLEEVCKRNCDVYVANTGSNVSIKSILRILRRHKITTTKEFLDTPTYDFEEMHGIGEVRLEVIRYMRKDIRRGFGY